MTDSTRDDTALLLACSNGDEQALGSLYDRYGKLGYGVALRVLRDAALAEDAVHDAFLTVAYWGGLTQPQIATALEIPLGTVKSRTLSALVKLRDALREATCLTAALC